MLLLQTCSGRGVKPGVFPSRFRANTTEADDRRGLSEPDARRACRDGHHEAMRAADPDAADAEVAISGFVDHHTHLLAAAAGTPPPWHGTTVRAFHEQVRRDGSTPMDVPEPDSAVAWPERSRLLYHGLNRAAAAGLVEVTEMGMRQWWYLDALAGLGD